MQDTHSFQINNLAAPQLLSELSVAEPRHGSSQAGISGCGVGERNFTHRTRNRGTPEPGTAAKCTVANACGPSLSSCAHQRGSRGG